MLKSTLPWLGFPCEYKHCISSEGPLTALVNATNEMRAMNENKVLGHQPNSEMYLYKMCLTIFP